MEFLLNTSLLSPDIFITIFSSASCVYIAHFKLLYLYFILFQPLHIFLYHGKSFFYYTTMFRQEQGKSVQWPSVRRV